MRKLSVFVLFVLLIVALSGCACKHETWNPADCTTPKTCAQCSETEGEPLGHDWADATCTEPKHCKFCDAAEGETLPHSWKDADCETPKSCENCDATEGAPLGHVWAAATCETAQTCQVCLKTEGDPLGHTWTDATCLLPKICDACKLTEGEPLGHSWMDATTEAPKTCEVCDLTDGERIITDYRFKTMSCKPYFGNWSCNVSITGEDLEIPGLSIVANLQMYLVLNNNGTMSLSVKLTNKEAFETAMTQAFADELYKEMANQGFGKAQADAQFAAIYGVNVTEFSKLYIEDLDFEGFYSSLSFSGVYYVNGNEMYIGYNWYEMYDHLIINSTNSLTWEDFYEEEGLDDLPFTR